MTGYQDEGKFGPTEDSPDVPYAFVQWKGTDACVDINCSCGELTHLDADMPFGVRCPYCKRVWKLGVYVSLLPADERLWKIYEAKP